MILLDWQRIMLNIRQVIPIARAARMMNMSPCSLRNYLDGKAIEPKFSRGLLILDLHHKLCPEKHDMEALKLCQPITAHT